MKMLTSVAAATIAVLMVASPALAQTSPEPPIPVDAALTINGSDIDATTVWTGETLLAASGFSPDEQVYLSIYVNASPLNLDILAADNAGALSATVVLSEIAPSTLDLVDGTYFLIAFGETSARVAGSFVNVTGAGSSPTTDPSTTDPSTTDPSTTDPSTTDPSTTDPSVPASTPEGQELPDNGPVATLPLILAAAAAGAIGLAARRRRTA